MGTVGIERIRILTEAFFTHQDGFCSISAEKNDKLECGQRGGRPAKYRCRPMFNGAKFG